MNAHRSSICCFVLPLLIAMAMIASACAPAVTPAPVQPTEAAPAPAQATEAAPAVAQPTEAAPTEAPAAPTEAAPAAATEELSGAAKDMKTLVVLVPNDTQTLDPAVNYDFSGGPILGGVYEPLVRAMGSAEAKIVPWLAEKWDISADGKTYTFTLHKDVKFHDGTPLNAEAVKFSFERLLKMNQGAVGNFTSIDKIEAVDDLTVKFTLKAPFGSFLYALTSLWGPVVVSPTAVKAHEVNNDNGGAWLAENDAGSGPYKLASWERNQQLTLVRNPDWWGGWGDKYLDKIIVRFVPETTTQRLMIEKGDADIAVGMSNEDLDALKTTPGVTVEEFAAMVIHELRINTTKKPLNDVKVRQALAYSLDYDQIVQGILNGHGKRLTSVTAEGVMGYYKPSFTYTKDLDKAKALLAEAGYPKGGFSLPYIWLTGNDIDRQIGEMWQADLKQLGIDLKVQEMPLNTWWEMQGKPETAPEMMMGQWGLDYADATSQLWLMYYSGNFPPTGSDYFYYKNEKVDKDLEQARVETDKAKMDKLYQDAVEMIYTDAPEVWVIQTNERIAHRSIVKGYQYNMSYYQQFFNFEKMYKEQ